MSPKISNANNPSTSTEKDIHLSLVLQILQFNSSQRPLLVNVGTEVATQPVGIYYPNETPKHPLKTIKVLNLFRLPYRGADNCHGMFVLQQEEQV